MDPSWWPRMVRPTTDLGVFLQLAALSGSIALLWWVARTRTDWRLVIAGLGLLLLSLIALRAAH